MFEELSKHLSDIILPMDFITPEAAKKLLKTTAKGIRYAVPKDKADIYLVDVLWRNEEEKGNGRKMTVLTLVDLIYGDDCVENEPEARERRDKREGKLQCKEIKINGEYKNDLGLWGWAYRNQTDIWLENVRRIRRLDWNSDEGQRQKLSENYVMLDESVRNNAGGMLDNLTDLVLYCYTNAIIVIPLTHFNGYESIQVGLLSIEARSGGFDEDIYRDLKRNIAPLIANLLWKLDVDRCVNYDTDKAVDRFERFIEACRFPQPEGGQEENGSRRRSVLVEPLWGLPRRRSDADVFVLMPFGEDTDWIYDRHIKKVAEQIRVSVKRADESIQTGSVMEDVWGSIYHAKTIVADCTGQNPNVIYELGIAHAVGKPVILIAKDSDRISFDIAHLKRINYSTSTPGMEELEKQLKQGLVTVLDRIGD